MCALHSGLPRLAPYLQLACRMLLCLAVKLPKVVHLGFGLGLVSLAAVILFQVDECIAQLFSLRLRLLAKLLRTQFVCVCVCVWATALATDVHAFPRLGHGWLGLQTAAQCGGARTAALARACAY